MSKLSIVLWIGVAVAVIFIANWIRKSDFIDVFATIFILVSLLAISLCGIYVYKEVTS